MGKLSTVLDMTKKARMLRAKEIGYFDDVLYHGTASKPRTTMPDGNIFDEFKLWEGHDPSRSTVRSPVSKLGISLAEQPELAQDFANLASRNGSEGSAILPLRFRADNVGAIDLLGDESNDDIFGAVVDAWKDGYDAIQFRNYTTPSGKKGSFVLVKDPSQIRSVNAAFDPAKKDSADLMAGLAAAGIGVGAMAPEDAMASENPSELMDALKRKASIDKFMELREKRKRKGSDFLGGVPMEVVSGINRGFIDTLNFLGPDQLNALFSVFGSDKRVPTLNDVPFIKKATEGNYMENAAEPWVRAGSEFLSPL